jgi:hypothetical protein
MSRAERFRPFVKTCGVLALLGSLLSAAPQQPGARLSTATEDPRLAELRIASAEWNLRVGPPRQVVDQVCLVPDVATFYEALASWDERHFFPILIDDSDLCLKFLRAFRPARIVRFPSRARPIEGDMAWERAVAAVCDAWTAEGASADRKLKGDESPTLLGKTPPGVVIGRPGSESLPGLAALAAGRFQPLLRVDSVKGFKDQLSAEEFHAFAAAIEAAIQAKLPSHNSLGDDCDFITLAGDYPYRYTSPKRSTGSPTSSLTGGPGTRAVDDGLGRSEPTLKRWAYAGRVVGDPRRSVYVAMCSLFLHPDRALLFNSYSESEKNFAPYTLRPSADRLRSILPTTLVTGEKRATLQGWHETFNPSNPFGLVLINSMGNPTDFQLPGGNGHSLDVMPSVPTAVCMIHSYSAADPTDPGTIAGRWLAQGAFLYHGSMDEPFLQSFRNPTFVSELLARGLPFGAAMRPLMFEAFGEPWKLVLLGDPLFRLQTRGPLSDRVTDHPVSSTWTAYAEPPPPAPTADESVMLAWAVNTALVRQTSSATRGVEDVIDVLRAIDRERLNSGARAVRDDLLLSLLYSSGRLAEVRAVYHTIALAERSGTATRFASSAAVAEFSRAIARRDFDRASGLWVELLRLDRDNGFKTQITSRLAALVDTPLRRDAWRRLLHNAIERLDKSETGEAIAEELKRVEKALAADRGRPSR